MAGKDRHFTHSTLRERIVEHVFIGDALRTLWRRGITDVEILRPEFDAHGYDVVMSHGPIVRYVQLKTQAAGKVSVGRTLAQKPSGCVVWIRLNKDTLELGPFMWFGGAPGRPLPDISLYPNPRRATHNAEGERPVRKNHRELSFGVHKAENIRRSSCEALWGNFSLMTVLILGLTSKLFAAQRAEVIQAMEAILAVTDRGGK